MLEGTGRRLLLGLAAVLLIGCSPVPAGPAGLAVVRTMTAEAARPSPEEVVASFYAWYIDYPANPLVVGSYKVHEYLTDAFCARVEETLASLKNGQGGFDPILLAQDVPESVTVERVDIDGDTAVALVSTSFAGHFLEVGLVRQEGQWLIDRVSPATAPR